MGDHSESLVEDKNIHNEKASMLRGHFGSRSRRRERAESTGNAKALVQFKQKAVWVKSQNQIWWDTVLVRILVYWCWVNYIFRDRQRERERRRDREENDRRRDDRRNDGDREKRHGDGRDRNDR